MLSTANNLVYPDNYNIINQSDKNTGFNQTVRAWQRKGPECHMSLHLKPTRADAQKTYQIKE